MEDRCRKERDRSFIKAKGFKKWEGKRWGEEGMKKALKCVMYVDRLPTRNVILTYCKYVLY